jgi:two-component system cell cycle response regulator
MPKRLLLIDPIPTHRIRLRATLRVAQYDVTSIDRIACAKNAVAADAPDLILLNTSGAEPTQMLTRLEKALGATGVPVLCRDEDAGPERRMRALANGARDMIAAKVSIPMLLARLRGLLRDSEAEAELERRRLAAVSFGFSEANASFHAPENIVSVDIGGLGNSQSLAVPDTYRHLKMTIGQLLDDGGQIAAPDAILLNVGEDGAEDLEAVLPEIRARGHLRKAAVLVLYPADGYHVAQRALNLGAAEISEDGSSEQELIHRISKMLARKRVRDALSRSTEESFRLATTDVLTGLYNRRYAEVYLSDTLLRANESGRGLTVLMLDIDHFKSVNDTYGHAAGDLVIREVADRIRLNLRAVDMVSRHGGEEFLVVMPEIDGTEAEWAADRLRSEIAATPIVLADGTELSVTVSVGVACLESVKAAEPPRSGQVMPEAGQGANPLIDHLITSADRALYSAKRAGRNRVSVEPLSASAA